MKYNEFLTFRDEIKRRLEEFSILEENKKGRIVKIAVDGNILKNAYVEALNDVLPIFIKRKEHDCNICKNFIEKLGKIAFIDENEEIHYLFDINVDTPYKVGADAIVEHLKDKKISGIFTIPEMSIPMLTIKENTSLIELNGELVPYKFDHLYLEKETIKKYVKEVPSMELINNFINSIDEIKLKAFKIVSEYKSCVSRYSDNEYLINTLKNYKIKKKEMPFDKFKLYVIRTYNFTNNITNTLIGQLLKDLSSVNKEDESTILKIIKEYNRRADPSNYMSREKEIDIYILKKLEKELKEKGIYDILLKRKTVDVYSLPISILKYKRILQLNNGQETCELADLFNITKSDSVIKLKIEDINSLKTITVNELMSDLKNIKEIYVSKDNEAVLTKPLNDANEPTVFKWGNNYNIITKEGFAGSSYIKEKVKKAGGMVEGITLRASLSWNIIDDYDIHAVEYYQNKEVEIYFADKVSNESGGQLDVDMNAHDYSLTRDAVENIRWKNIPSSLKKIEIFVKNYREREKNTPVDATVEIEFNGRLYTCKLPRKLKNKERITVAYIYPQDGRVEFTNDVIVITSMISTNGEVELVPVAGISYSPNMWEDTNGVGLKQLVFYSPFFEFEDKVVPFAVEQLNSNLLKYRGILNKIKNKIELYTDSKTAFCSLFDLDNPNSNKIIKIKYKDGKSILAKLTN